MVSRTHDGHLADHVPAAGLVRRSVSISPGTIWLITGIIVALGITAYILANAIHIFVLVFVAITFAEAIRPLMDWLHRRGMPRPLAVLLIYLALVGVLAFLVFLLVRPIIAQVGQLQNALPQYAQAGQHFFSRILHFLGQNPQVASAVQQVQSKLGNVITTLVGYVLYLPVALAGAVVAVVAIVAMAFFWLTGTDQLLPFVVSLFPAPSQLHARSVFEELGTRLGGYVRGVVFNMIVIGILSGAGNFLLGVPYAVLLGILAGLTEVLPYIGPWIGGTAAVLVALFSGGLLKAVEVAAWYVLLQMIEGHTLVPLVMYRAVRVNPMTVIIAVLVGGTLFGIVGGVLAVPVAAVLHVLVVRVLAPAARNAAARHAARSQPVAKSASEPESPGIVAPSPERPPGG